MTDLWARRQEEARSFYGGIEELRHRTGRAIIRFGDSHSRDRGRNFLRRLIGVGGKTVLQDFAEHGIGFQELWSFDIEFTPDPADRAFAHWQSRRREQPALVRALRRSAAGLRAFRGVRRGPFSPAQRSARATLKIPDLFTTLPDALEELASEIEYSDAALPHRAAHAPSAEEATRAFRQQWEKLARCQSKRPLDNLGAVLFSAVFAESITGKTFKRRRLEDRAQVREVSKTL